MPDISFTRPTLTQILERIRADINSRVPGADSSLRRSFLNASTAAHAGQVHGLYSGIIFALQQALPTTATVSYLEGWGATYGIARLAASKAEGLAVFTGTNGSNIPAGVLLQRSDAVEYETVNSGTIAGGTATILIRAVVAGDTGNAIANTSLSLISAVPGVNSQAVVDVAGLGGGADLESDDSYRDRILFRIQQPPHGGNANDYIRWTLENPGVSRAWVYPLENGPGTVVVRFVMDDVYPPDGIPLIADVNAVQAYIDDPGRRPVTAQVFVQAPVAVPVNINVSGLNPNTPEIRAAIVAELADMIRRERFPGGSPEGVFVPGTIFLSKIWEAVSIATGENNHIITSPIADVTFNTNEIATLGTVSFL